MTALFADDAGSLEFVELPDSESLGRAIAERPEKNQDAEDILGRA